MPVEIEVCIDSVHGARAALDGGVRRLETCGGLSDGGLTPSIGLVRLIDSWQAGAEQYVMIRPRGGDFAYSADEVQVMEDDIRAIQALRLPSVKGFVFGCLTADRALDEQAMQRLMSVARPQQVTLHRAVDVCRDYDGAFAAAVKLGVDCVLTSGNTGAAMDGIENIRRVVAAYGGRVQIMPGSGVKPENARQLLATGARKLHFSAKCRVASSYASISMGSADSGDGYNSASKETVERMLAAVREAKL